MMALGQRLQPLAFLFTAHLLDHRHDPLKHRTLYLTGIDQVHHHSLGITGKLFRDLKSCLLRHAKRIALELPQLLLISHLIEHIHNGSKSAILPPSPFSGYLSGRRGRQAILIAYTVK